MNDRNKTECEILGAIKGLFIESQHAYFTNYLMEEPTVSKHIENVQPALRAN